MDERADTEAVPMKNHTAERTSERAFVVKRTFNAPARIVFEAWIEADLFKRWWVPKSCGLTLLSCELDVRVGGKYRLVYGHQGSTMPFFGTYREVTPPSRLVWTNEEDDGETVTTVTFDEKDGKTSLVVHDLYSSKETLDAAIASGATDGMPETLDQLDAFLTSLGSRAENAQPRAKELFTNKGYDLPVQE